MEGLDRIIDKTIHKCANEGIKTNEKEVTGIIKHYFDKIEYLFDMTKEGILNVQMVEIIGFGKLITKEWKIKKKRERLEKKNPELHKKWYEKEIFTLSKSSRK